MKIKAENKVHTPGYPVIAAVAAAAMLALPACVAQTLAPQALKGHVKPKVESKEAGKKQRSQQPVMGKRPPQGVVGKKPKVESKEVGKDQRSQQPVMGSVVPPTKPVRPPQRVCGRKKVTPPKR